MEGMKMNFLLLSSVLIVHCQLIKTVCASSIQRENNETTSGGDVVTLHEFRQLKQLVYQLNHTLTNLQWEKREDVIHTSFLAMAKESASYENKDVVKFQTVKHSVAPPNFGYDSMLSFYRCPYDGTYVFGFSVTTSTASKHNRFSIVKEGVTVGSSNAYDATGYQGMTTMVITTCKKGQDVWVANTGGHKTGVYNPVEGDNHFTGFRLV